MNKFDIAENNDLSSSLDAIKFQILNETKVASIGVVREVDSGNEIAKVELYPYLEDESSQFVYVRYAVNVSKDDIVVVLFMDRNFIQNLNQLKSNNRLTPLKDYFNLHSLKYGIVINNLSSPSSPSSEVNDATLTIKKNGVTIETFTANSATNKTADITVPTKTSDLTNDNGFITNTTANITEGQVTNLTSDLQNIREVAEGKSTNYVINSKSEITGTEDPTTHNYSNVSAITGIDISKLKVGDNIYIKDTDIPDYWVSEIYTDSSTTVDLSKLETVKPNIASISVNGVNIAPVNENVNIVVPTQIQKYRHVLRITRIYAGNYPGGTILTTIDSTSSTAITTISDAITAIRTYAGGTGSDYYIQATGFYASSSSSSYNICGVYISSTSIYGVFANAYGKNQVDMGGIGSGSFTVTDNVITL